MSGALVQEVASPARVAAADASISLTVADLVIIGVLATRGILMAVLAPGIVTGLLLAAFVFAFVLDAVKLAAFHRLAIV